MDPPPAAPFGKVELGACPNERPTIKRNVAVENADVFLFILMRVGIFRNIVFYMEEDPVRRIKNPLTLMGIKQFNSRS
jgi:hypothetical protein